MSRIGFFFVGVCVVAVSAAGCADGSMGGGGSGGGGSGGMGGTAGGGTTGGTGGGAPRPCASTWETPPPPATPIASNMCTYDFPSAAPPTRDCDQGGDTRLLFEYDASKPCGMPCVTGRPRGGSAVGTHFDAALLPLVGAQTLLSGEQFNRTEYDLDAFGNEIRSRAFDADDQPLGSATTTYVTPEQPTSFESRIDGNPMVTTTGTMTWNSDGQLETYEEVISASPAPRAFYTYTYNTNGTLDVVTFERDPGTPVGAFTFSYAPDMVTVTFDLADGTPQSLLTFDYVCAP